MSYNLVNPTTGALTRVAGGTLYADLPIGSWIKNDMDAIPSGFLKEGDTINQTLYPELYAKYGPTVPYKADTSELSDYENITLSTDSSNPTVMPYDGVYILANYGVSNIHHIYLNGIKISAGITGNNTTGASMSSTILFKKGDTMYRLNTYIESSTFVEHVAYYKKSLIVKAKHVGIPSDFIDAIDDATVDTVANGNMHPVTSNAVYDELNKVEIIDIANLCTDVISCEALSVWATKSGRVVTLRIQVTNAVLNTVSDSYDTREVFTLPAAYRPKSNMLVTWLGQALNDAYCGDIRTDGLVHFWQWGSHTAPGTRSIVAQVTYII